MKLQTKVNLLPKIRADIEINTNCNARCVFCPQRISPKKTAIMTMDDFKIIVDFLLYNNIKFVSLNHYGEPLLDSHILERIQFLNQSKIRVALFSNIITLNPDLVKELSKEKNIYDFFINLPSIDKKEWAKLTGVSSSLHQPILSNLKLLSRSFKGNITVLVAGSDTSQPNRSLRIKEYFHSFKNINVKKLITNDRGGILRNKYTVKCTPEKSNIGCHNRFNVLNISSGTEIFLCCQDFDQKYLIGYNIASHYRQYNSHKGISEVIKMNRRIMQPVECKNCIYQDNTYAILPE